MKELKSDLRANLRPKTISLKLNKAYSKSDIGLKYLVWAEKMRIKKGYIKSKVKLSPKLVAFWQMIVYFKPKTNYFEPDFEPNITPDIVITKTLWTGEHRKIHPCI